MQPCGRNHQSRPCRYCKRARLATKALVAKDSGQKTTVRKRSPVFSKHESVFIVFPLDFSFKKSLNHLKSTRIFELKYANSDYGECYSNEDLRIELVYSRIVDECTYTSYWSIKGKSLTDKEETEEKLNCRSDGYTYSIWRCKTDDYYYNDILDQYYDIAGSNFFCGPKTASPLNVYPTLKIAEAIAKYGLHNIGCRNLVKVMGESKIDITIELIEDLGLNIKYSSNFYWACMNGYLDLAELLYNNGGDYDTEIADKYILMRVCQKNLNLDVLKFLLAKGFDPCMSHPHPDDACSALHVLLDVPKILGNKIIINGNPTLLVTRDTIKQAIELIVKANPKCIDVLSPKMWGEPGVNAVTNALNNVNYDEEIVSFYRNLCRNLGIQYD